MAYFEPDGNIRLCSVPITDGQQLVFKSADSQRSYFETNSGNILTEMSYMAHDGIVSVEMDPSDIKNYNYIMWENPTQEGRVWYARITNYKWINSAATTEIHYAIDWFQSFMFEHTINFAEMDREQLSETSWNAAMTNPFDPSIIELGTPEPIAVGKEFEPIYDKGDMVFYPASDTNLATQSLLFIMNLGWIDDLSSADQTKFKDSIEKNEGKMVTPGTISSFPTVLGYIWFPLVQREGSSDSARWSSFIDFITIYGLTSEIIGIYDVNNSMISSIENTGSAIQETITINKPSKLMHPKLARSPFRYIRVTSPSGVSKEYQYEKFDSLRTGGDTAQLIVSHNVLGNPVTYISPNAYEYKSSGVIFESINYHERIEYADMPQVGMNIDAYLTFLSSQYSSAISANNAAQQTRNSFYGSKDYQIKLLQDTGLDKDIFSEMAGSIKAELAAQFSPNMTEYAGQDIYNAQRMYAISEATAKGQEIEQSINVLKDAATRTTTSNALAYAKGAYVADIYRPGGSAGYIPYQIGRGTPQWHMVLVRPEEHYEARIVEFLNRYGCKSGRFGTPYVYQYMKGGESPHWAEIDGHQATYCKCNNIEVICNMAPASAAISSIYRSGCLFIKGD